MKKKVKSRILGHIFEGAQDLYKVGAINEQRINRYKKRCLRLSARSKPKRSVGRAVVSKSVREALTKASRAVKRSLVPVSPHDAAALLSALSGNGANV